MYSIVGRISANKALLRTNFTLRSKFAAELGVGVSTVLEMRMPNMAVNTDAPTIKPSPRRLPLRSAK